MTVSVLGKTFCMIVLGLALVPAVYAQTFPSRPVRVVVAFPPGTPGDMIVRGLAPAFLEATKQPLVIENHPGAGGNIGAEQVARAPADGYTFLATIDTVVTANPSLYRNLSFKADRDLTPVIYTANTAQTLVCNPRFGARSMDEFVSQVRSTRTSYASGGAGVPGHLAAELFLSVAGLRMDHVPYKGPAPATQDVIAGNVPCGFLATPVVMPHVRGGRLVGLAVTSLKRSPIAPDVPTVAEAGVPGYQASFGELILAPRGVPASIVTRMNEVVATLLASGAIRERMLAADLEFVPNSPADAEARVRAEAKRWGAVIESLGLRVD